MILSTHQAGYALLEALIALAMLSLVTHLSLKYQHQQLQRSAQQFQELSTINDLHNTAERHRANVFVGATPV